MIFSGVNLDRVLDGTKTQTRRPVRVNRTSSLLVKVFVERRGVEAAAGIR